MDDTDMPGGSLAAKAEALWEANWELRGSRRAVIEAGPGRRRTPDP